MWRIIKNRIFAFGCRSRFLIEEQSKAYKWYGARVPQRKNGFWSKIRQWSIRLWRIADWRGAKILKDPEAGFTIVELALACLIFPIIVIGISNAYDGVRRSYTISKQLNEMYSILSSCPEFDRALDYASLSSATNCFPTNTVSAEGGSSTTITYNPTLTVVDTSTLGAGDPLRPIPDSKVLKVSLPFLKNTNTPPLEVRMVITRNGVGQL